MRALSQRFQRSAFFSTLCLAVVGLFIGQSAHSKELNHRLGLGFRNTTAIDIPSLSAQYYPSSDFGIITALGIDTEDKNSRFAFTVGVRKIIFREDNLNFFFGGALSLLNSDNGVDKKSGFELAAPVGAEFFLPGLDSLGFNFETGVAVTNLNKVRFRTLADSFIRSGIVFYF